MRQLRLVGPGEDGPFLIVEAPSGERFRLPIDERLRAACRGDLSRLGQLEIDNGSLRPREIQFRVRAGESAEQVAASAGVSLERVLRFAYPVLQERQRVVAQARGTRIRRPGAPPAETLDELVNERLVGRGTDAASLVWDAWRREDGTWTVSLSWHGVRDHSASWTFELAARTLHADDPAAEQLIAAEFHLRTITPVTPLAALAQVSADPTAEAVARPAARPAQPPAARPVPQPVPQPATQPPAQPARPGTAQPARPAAAHAARPAAQPAAAQAAEPAAHPAAEPAAQPTGRRAARPARPVMPPVGPVAARLAADRISAGADPDDQGDEPPAVSSAQTTLPIATATGHGDPDEQEPDEDGEAGRRAHVPSWDDILLGVRRRH